MGYGKPLEDIKVKAATVEQTVTGEKKARRTRAVKVTDNPETTSEVVTTEA